METRLRLEFQTQFDQMKELLTQSLVSINKTLDTTCPTDVKWDTNVDRCRSPDGKFVNTNCCETNQEVNQDESNLNKKDYNRSKPPSYFILLLVDRYKGKYALASEFHKQVNHILVDNGIPHLSPQQIRIFVNLHGYSIVKMNGLNTYKFLC